MFDFSPIQILIVLAIALLVLGPKRLPEMGRSLGRGLRELRGSLGGDDRADAAERGPWSQPDPVDARQEPPAPTPQIAQAEAAERATAVR
jgi:sec-independent protein translocase protein TatA